MDRGRKLGPQGRGWNRHRRRSCSWWTRAPRPRAKPVITRAVQSLMPLAVFSARFSRVGHRGYRGTEGRVVDWPPRDCRTEIMSGRVWGPGASALEGGAVGRGVPGRRCGWLG